MTKKTITEDIITENTKKENNEQKPKKKQPTWLTVFIMATFTALCSYSITAIQYIKVVDTKEERIQLLEEETKIFKEQISKYIELLDKQKALYLELLDKQKVLAEEKLVKDKKNYEKLVEWVYKNSSKISKKTAEEIVTLTLETNFPLMNLAIMKTESSFDPTSISTKGASGIGQQMPKDYEEPLIEAGIISEWRDIFNIPQGVKATEFAWNDKFKLGKGHILESLKLYYGENNREYIDQILIDHHYLVYLCNFDELEEQEETNSIK